MNPLPYRKDYEGPMYIDTIELRNFRNYGRITIKPDSGINVFYGKNGAGKTNILEAVHFCALGKSHRCNLDYEVIRYGCEMGACGVNVRSVYGGRNVIVKLLKNNKGKQVYLDQKKASRLYEMMGCLKCIIFSPEDLALIKDGPGQRRRFIDMFVSQMDQKYFLSLQKFSVALEQRNSMIRRIRAGDREDQDIFSAFESEMAETAAYICRRREEYLKEIDQLTRELYHEISDSEEEKLSLSYDPSAGRSFEKEDLQACFEKLRKQDIIRGSTTVGPHRDTVFIQMNGRDMKLFASQGQIRSAALSLRIAELRIIHKKTGEYPVLLLDDVLSELDMNRRMNLLKMTDGIQTFITCTDPSDLKGLEELKSFHVINTENGAIIERDDCLDIREDNIVEPDFS